MKNFKYILLVWLCSLLIATSCNEYEGGDNPEYVNVELSEYSITLVETDGQRVLIKTEDNSYKVTSSDALIASAEIVNGEIVVAAVKEGRALLSLRNDGNKRAKVEVIVTKLQDVTLDKKLLDINLGPNGEQNTQVVAIKTGNGEYSAVSSKPEFATVEVIDNTVSVTGIAEGESIITVTDRKGKTAELTVNVIGPSYDLTVDVDPLTPIEIVKGSPAVVINITGGNEGYQVVSSDANVISASLSGTKITLNSVKDGYATVTLTDRKGRKIEFSLIVPFDLNDNTERIYWDGYRADIETHSGASSTFTWGSTKIYQWAESGGSNTIKVTHTGTIQNPTQPKIIIDNKTIALDAIKSEKVDPEYTSGEPALNSVFWVTFEKDGKKGFIVSKKKN